jgi:hypothetical protein
MITVAVIGIPLQPFTVGVIIKVTVTAALVVFVKVPLMAPLPLAKIPVAATVLSLVQLKIVEATLPDKTIAVIALVEHIVCDAGVATAFGVGFTRTVAVIDVPGHPFTVGVMVKVTVTGALVVFVKLPLMFPLPLAAIPVTATVLSLDQLNEVEATLPESAIDVIALAEHMVCDAGVATALGVGFTKTVAVIGVPGHPFAVGIMLKVTVTGILVEFVRFPLMFPLPLARIPVTATVLSLVQLKVVEAMLPERTIVAIAFVEQIV